MHDESQYGSGHEKNASGCDFKKDSEKAGKRTARSYKNQAMKMAAYCRVSTDKEEQLDSLANQKEFFIEYAKKNGHELVGLYTDDGISGIRLKKRAGFQMLMADAEQRQFELVVVKDVSRLARNTVDFLQSIRALKTFGINTLFLTANMDSLGASEFVLTLFGAMAQEESANLSRRVKFGKQINAKKGRVPPCIFGYDRLDNFRLVINLKEAKIVREIFRLYTEEGLGCRRICTRLNESGYQTKLGCDWNPTSVRRILQNSIYCGIYSNHKYETIDYLTGKQELLPEDQRFYHDRPEWALISRELFQQTQDLIKSRKLKRLNTAKMGLKSSNPDKLPEELLEHHTSRYSGKYLFSTLIQCANCGRSFCRKQYTYRNTRVYWKCPTYDQKTASECDNQILLEEPDLMQKISDYLIQAIGDLEEFLSAILADLQKSKSKISAKKHKNKDKDIEKNLHFLQAKQERYREMYANGIINMNELKSRTGEITEEVKRLTCESSHLQMQKISDVSGQESELDTQIIRNWIRDFLYFDDVLNLELRQMIQRICVYPDGRVQIFWERWKAK